MYPDSLAMCWISSVLMSMSGVVSEYMVMASAGMLARIIPAMVDTYVASLNPFRLYEVMNIGISVAMIMPAEISAAWVVFAGACVTGRVMVSMWSPW